MKVKLVSVIVPAYKQEKKIVKDLRNIYNILQKLRYKTEVICVVDGKVDKTFDEAYKFAQRYKNIKVYGYDTNKGKGYAVRFGMAKSKGDVIAFIDAGMDLNPNGLSMCLEHFEWYNADIIIGSKRHPASRIDYPWQRRTLSIGYQILVRLLFGLNIRDTQVGMKFFRRAVLEKVLPRLLVKAFAFDIEMLAVSSYLGFKRIFEAPIELEMQLKASTIASKGFVRIAWLMFLDTLAVFYRLQVLRYYADKNSRKWRFDPELSFRVNVG